MVLAESWKIKGIIIETHVVDLRRLGRQAWSTCNQKMINAGVDEYHAFPLADSGPTLECMESAAEAGLPVCIHEHRFR